MNEIFMKDFELGVRRILSREGIKYQIVDNIPIISFGIDVPIKISKHKKDEFKAYWISEPAAYALAKHAILIKQTDLFISIIINDKMAFINACPKKGLHIDIV